jgi:hypothetical protein
MSLMGAPTGEEALKLKEESERKTESPVTQGGDARQAVDKKRGALLALGLLAMSLWSIVICGVLGSYVAICALLAADGIALEPNYAEVQQRLMYEFFGLEIAVLGLASAPWLVAGVVFGVRRWRSRKSAGPKDTE